MHNWFIASMVSAGIWTEEQGKHVAENIKTSIHKENFNEALIELNAILGRGEFGMPLVQKLESDISNLESKVKILTEQLATKVENTPIAKASKHS
jgi:polyhydroxyalkanoate synthesis regulator phasin